MTNLVVRSFHQLELFVILFQRILIFIFILAKFWCSFAINTLRCIPYAVIFVMRRLPHFVLLSDILGFWSQSVYAGTELQDPLNCFDHSSGAEYVSAYWNKSRSVIGLFSALISVSHFVVTIMWVTGNTSSSISLKGISLPISNCVKTELVKLGKLIYTPFKTLFQNTVLWMWKVPPVSRFKYHTNCIWFKFKYFKTNM